jgi:hypothetical protein
MRRRLLSGGVEGTGGRGESKEIGKKTGRQGWHGCWKEGKSRANLGITLRHATNLPDLCCYHVINQNL